MSTTSIARPSTVVPLLARVLTVALLVGGAFGAVNSFLLNKSGWPWQMPDLAYRFLAAAAAAYVVGSVIALKQRHDAATGILMATVVLYGVPLGVALLIEPGPVTWDKPIAWGFVGLVVPALIISGAYLWQEDWQHHGQEPIRQELRVAMIVLGIVASLVGLIVYLVPRDSGFIWPWAELGPWKPLDTRLLASMLITIGGASLLVALQKSRAMADVFLPMLWAYCLVASIGVAIHAVETPAFRTEDIAYIAIFSLVLLVTLVLDLRDRGVIRSRAR